MMAVLLAAHLICAVGATLAFWASAAADKGGGFHRMAGLWFVRLTYGAAVTGGTMALVGLGAPSWLASSLADLPTAAIRHLMWLVLYLLVVIVAPAQHGLAVLRAGDAPAQARSRPHLVLNLAALLGTVALFPAAIIWHAWPFLLVVPAGFIVGVRDMQYASRGAANAPEREREHLTSMITAGIALHTTVLVLSAARWPDLIGPGVWQLGPWLLPVLIGLAAIVWLRGTGSAKAEGRQQKA